MEGLTDIADLENTLYRWAEDIRLSQEELDEVRLFKGGELKFLLSHIEEDSSIYDLMILLRKKGAIFQIHQQQILDQALPGDPDLIYSQTAIQNYAEYLFEKALKITGARNPSLYEKIRNYRSKILEGIRHEMNTPQQFPYPYQSVQLTHSWNPDREWSYGFENIRAANLMDGLHQKPPSLLLKSLGLVYGTKTIRWEQNFFTEEIKKEEEEEDGILALLEKGETGQAYFLAGRLLALAALCSLPEQMDTKYPDQESVYRDRWIPGLINGIQEIVNKPSDMALEADFFNENWMETEYKQHILNYLDNDLIYTGNISSVLERIAQRADFYSSPGKMGNGLYEWDSDFTPYYPAALNHKDWNYLPYSALYVLDGNTGGMEKVVMKLKSGETVSVHRGIMEMTMHLQPLAVAGMVKILNFLGQ
jgi:hypothetical protein